MIYLQVKENNKMSEERNRSDGWKHAKRSGHNNEKLLKDLLDTDKEYLKNLLKRIKYENVNVSYVSIGGLHETNVCSVNGKTTKSKTDLKIVCTNGKTINISIKKSLGGQVYFIRASLFFEVFQKQFNKEIPTNVQRAIRLFWAEAEDAITIIEKYADKTDIKNYEQQIRHKSVNATTLIAYDKLLADELLAWFRSNIYELTQLSFAMGAAKDPIEWSEFVWYKNLLGENSVDDIISIEEICKKASKNVSAKIYFGDKNGGTTIQLPFGFVQWHQRQMQFHHDYCKIMDLLRF